nr:hypothetical protein HEP84_04290 [Streptomyces sp. RLB1-33]
MLHITFSGAAAQRPHLLVEGAEADIAAPLLEGLGPPDRIRAEGRGVDPGAVELGLAQCDRAVIGDVLIFDRTVADRVKCGITAVWGFEVASRQT